MAVQVNSSIDIILDGQNYVYSDPIRISGYSRFTAGLLGTTDPLSLPAWNSATAYDYGDLVYDDGENYFCVDANTNQNPYDNTDYWVIYAAVGDYEFQVTSAEGDVQGVPLDTSWISVAAGAFSVVQIDGPAKVAPPISICDHWMRIQVFQQVEGGPGVVNIRLAIQE